jgi:hypothetical protein
MRPAARRGQTFRSGSAPGTRRASARLGSLEGSTHDHQKVLSTAASHSCGHRAQHPDITSMRPDYWSPIAGPKFAEVSSDRASNPRRPTAGGLPSSPSGRMRAISTRPRRRSSSIRTSPPCRLRRLRQICGHEVLQPDITGKALARSSRRGRATWPPSPRGRPRTGRLEGEAQLHGQLLIAGCGGRPRGRDCGKEVYEQVERLGHHLQGTCRGLGAGPCYMASAIPQRIRPQAQRTSSATPVHG